MNLTLTQAKQKKQPSPMLTPHVQTLPQTSSWQQNSVKEEQRKCDSIFFVNCMSGHASENKQESEMLEVLNIHRLHELQLPDLRKKKISLSITQRSSQQHRTPKAANKQQMQTKPVVEMSPFDANRNVSQSIGIKLTLNGNYLTQIKGKREVEQCQYKQTRTKHSIQQAKQSQRKEIGPISTLKRDGGQKQQAQHFLQKRIVNFDSSNIQEGHFLVEKSEQSEKEAQWVAINWKQRLRERRWIGEYAKTIKTLNASDPKQNESQIESVVIERGMLHQRDDSGRMVAPFNRGSIKQCRIQADTLKRAYGSVGDSLHKVHLDSRYKNLVDQTIEEDLYDSQL